MGGVGCHCWLAQQCPLDMALKRQGLMGSPGCTWNVGVSRSCQAGEVLIAEVTGASDHEPSAPDRTLDKPAVNTLSGNVLAEWLRLAHVGACRCAVAQEYHRKSGDFRYTYGVAPLCFLNGSLRTTSFTSVASRNLVFLSTPCTIASRGTPV